MRAVMLAAGIGNRLGHLGSQPKSLLEFGGKSLLARHLENLAQHGVRDITLCVGYRAEEVERAAHHPACQVDCVRNDQFRRGSVRSLWTVRARLRQGDSLILMDADVLYEPRIMTRLVDSRHDNCFLLDEDFTPGDEPVKICVRDDRIIEFRKKLDPELRFDLWGESVGFFKFSPLCAAALADICERYIVEGRDDEPYEEAIRDLILAQQFPLGFEPVGGLAWVEIDFPEDITRANNLILPKVEASHA